MEEEEEKEESGDISDKERESVREQARVKEEQ